jgi:hypothetical protein
LLEVQTSLQLAAKDLELGLVERLLFEEKPGAAIEKRATLRQD